MKRRDRKSSAKVPDMPRKKQKQEPEENPNLAVDEQEFTKVIRNLANTPPMPFKKIERRKNPETDPRYVPVFPDLVKKQKDRK